MNEAQPPLPAPHPSARLLSLDVLRAVAVTLVIGRHITMPLYDWNPKLTSLAYAWQRGGWVGVDLFFVLSGFLVSGLLFREYRARGRTRIGRFLIRRGLKIYPGFYVMLIATAINRLHHVGSVRALLPAFLSEALFVQNYGPRLCAHTWSLAVEEHFYLLCSLLIYVLVKRGRGQEDPFRSIPRIFLGVAILSLAARIATAIARPLYEPWTHSFPSHLRMDGLMFGVLLAYCYHFKTQWLTSIVSPFRGLWIVAGMVLIAPAFFFQLEVSPWIYTVGYSLFYLGSGLIVVGFVHGELRPTRAIRFVAFLGSCSYSIYLWHWMARWWAARLFEKLHRPSGSMAEFGVYFLWSFVIGVVMAKLVELPVLRLRDRLIPSRTPSLEAPLAGA